jgi:hypothetical protein
MNKVEYFNIEKHKALISSLVYFDIVFWFFVCYFPMEELFNKSFISKSVVFSTIGFFANVAFLMYLIQAVKLKNIILFRAIIDNVLITFLMYTNSSMFYAYLFSIQLLTVTNVVVLENRFLYWYTYILTIVLCIYIAIFDYDLLRFVSIGALLISMFITNLMMNIPKRINEELENMRSTYKHSFLDIVGITKSLILAQHKELKINDSLCTYVEDINKKYFGDFLPVILKNFNSIKFENNSSRYVKLNIKLEEYLLPFLMLFRSINYEGSSVVLNESSLVVSSHNINKIVIDEVIRHIKPYISNYTITDNFVLFYFKEECKTNEKNR